MLHICMYNEIMRRCTPCAYLWREDDHDLNHVVVRKLQSEGNHVDACEDGNGRAGAARPRPLRRRGARHHECPSSTVWSWVRQLRREGNETPVLVLDREGFHRGSRGRIGRGRRRLSHKPFALEELSARVRALTRRRTEHRDNIYQIEDLTLDIKRRLVCRGGPWRSR